MSGMEPLLFGVKATSTAAATTGLFGSAGAFSLGTTLGTMGSAMGALSAINQGRSQDAYAKYNAAMSEQQARYERDLAAGRESDYRRDQSALLARQRALAAASGGEFSGSSLLLAEDIASEGELNALRIRAGGDMTARRLEQEAGLMRMQGASAKQAGYMRAGASLLEGASKWGSAGGTTGGTTGAVSGGGGGGLTAGGGVGLRPGGNIGLTGSLPKQYYGWQ